MPATSSARPARSYYKRVRFQQILFRIAQLILEDLMQGADNGSGALGDARLARHHLFPEIVAILRRYADKKIRFAPGVDKRELGLEKYVRLLRERIRDNILPEADTEEAPLLPVVNSFQPHVTTADVGYRTTRPVVRLTKSHLNVAMLQSGWEREAVEILEELDFVEYYTPIDRNVGLVVPYEYKGNPHNYEPDREQIPREMRIRHVGQGSDPAPLHLPSPISIPPDRAASRPLRARGRIPARDESQPAAQTAAHQGSQRSLLGAPRPALRQARVLPRILRNLRRCRSPATQRGPGLREDCGRAGAEDR